MKTNILHDRLAREKLLAGINEMAETVGGTLGPRGQNVALTKIDYKGNIYARDIIHDGVGVARSIDLTDEEENTGAQILLEAAQKQVDEVGDGTTVVMILAQAIITECYKMISTGINPMSLRPGLEAGLLKLTRKLKTLSKPIKTQGEIAHIASISAQDELLGKLVAGVFKKVGEDGVITVEEGHESETSVEYQVGMQFEPGMAHELFVTNPDLMQATLSKTYILATDKPLTTLVPLTNFFAEFLKKSKNLVIIAPDISGEALALLLKNKMEMMLNCIAIKAPSFGLNQRSVLQDINVLTGGKFLTEDAGFKFEELTVADLGFADQVTCSKNTTVIIGGHGKSKVIQSRINLIKSQMGNNETEYDREKMKERAAKLSNGVAIISVGGKTEIEMKERRERIIDSVAATKAAIKGGIVPGGEVIYHALSGELNTLDISERVLANALKEPFRKLISNAGIDRGDAATALYGKPLTWGIDVTDSLSKDMVEAGIVDPTLVSLHALQNAVSVAVALITTGSTITHKLLLDTENKNPS